MEERRFAVALFLGPPHVNCHGGKETVALLPDDWGIEVARFPDGVLVVSEGNYPRLGSKRDAYFVIFDGLHAHGREDLDVAVFGFVLLPGER